MRKSIIFVVLAALLLLTACAGGKKDTGAKGAFLGGTQGAVGQFEPFGVEEQGISTIFDTEAFPISLNLRNKGEYDLQPGDVKVTLLGPSSEEFNGIPAWTLSNTGLIEKISELVPNGGEEVLSFAGDAQYTKEVTGIVDRQWFGNIEYKYQTYLIVPEVCLKEDLTDKRVCEVVEAKKFFVSGAPITVTAVEESTAGRGIMALKVKIKNAGSGKVTKPAEEFGLNNNLAYSLDDPAWECKSGGKVNEARLVDGEAEIVCKLKDPLAAKTLSTKQVKLTMDYKYRDLIQETLRIKESTR